MSFPSLSGDAVIVAPVRSGRTQAAAAHHVEFLGERAWTRVAAELERWHSSGRGDAFLTCSAAAPWAHVRIDVAPIFCVFYRKR